MKLIKQIFSVLVILVLLAGCSVKTKGLNIGGNILSSEKLVHGESNEIEDEEKSIVDLISEQPLENTAYWYIVGSDLFIPREHIEELVEILDAGNWEEKDYIANDETQRTIVINFNEFPEGKNADNFDYSMGTYVKTQLSIDTESNIAFNSYSTKGRVYALNKDTVEKLQNFINLKAVEQIK
jgi:hypothetical protein